MDFHGDIIQKGTNSPPRSTILWKYESCKIIYLMVMKLLFTGLVTRARI